MRTQDKEITIPRNEEKSLEKDEKTLSESEIKLLNLIAEIIVNIILEEEE